MSPDRAAVLRDLEPTVEGLLEHARTVEESWQPSEELPDMGSEGWHEEITALREEAGRLTDEMLVVLVGNIVTEEALPSYQTAINRYEGIRDLSGVDDTVWARWTRAWTAEENRHGDVTRTYLFLAGRVDFASVEATVQHLLRNGFDTYGSSDPYRGMAYASVQEHATKVCWNQLGTLAGSVGAPRLHRICGLVAADEARHERFYRSLLREVVRRDPEGALEALSDVLGHAVVMPARRMTDGADRRLFAHFAEVGQRIGVYTAEDYLLNLAELVSFLGLPGLTGLSAAAEQARDEVCAVPERYRAMGAGRPTVAARPVPFRWIHGRSA